MEICTLPEIAAGTHFHALHGTKTTSAFLPAYERPLGCYFQVQSLYNHVGQFFHQLLSTQHLFIRQYHGKVKLLVIFFFSHKMLKFGII